MEEGTLIHLNGESRIGITVLRGSQFLIIGPTFSYEDLVPKKIVGVDVHLIKVKALIAS